MHVHQHRQAVFAQRIDAFGHILQVGHGHLNAFRGSCSAAAPARPFHPPAEPSPAADVHRRGRAVVFRSQCRPAAPHPRARSRAVRPGSMAQANVACPPSAPRAVHEAAFRRPKCAVRPRPACPPALSPPPPCAALPSPRRAAQTLPAPPAARGIRASSVPRRAERPPVPAASAAVSASPCVCTPSEIRMILLPPGPAKREAASSMAAAISVPSKRLRPLHPARQTAEPSCARPASLPAPMRPLVRARVPCSPIDPAAPPSAARSGSAFLPAPRR